MTLPLVTVIMPVRNEGNFLLRSLGAVLAQDYPADRFEVLVADGNSTDETPALIDSLRKEHPGLRRIPNPPGIVSTGLNAALREAKGEIIVRIDGHTEIAPDYVRQCVAAIQRTGADNVGGRMVGEGRSPFGKAVAAATSSPFGIGGSRFHFSKREEWVDSVYMGCWKKEVFERVGLFDEELVRDQDDEFNYRLGENGARILLCPAIRSVYETRSSPRSLWRQYFQYGLWKVRVMQKHPSQMSLRHFIPPSFVATLAVLAPLALFQYWAAILLAGVLGLYAVSAAAASFITAAKFGARNLPYLPFVFPMLHISYGAGFLAGLFRFASRWGDREGRVPRLNQKPT